jgi:hypothetical protein
MAMPLLSVVIPTRNRQHYCIAAIENILSFNHPALELCIHDNSDDDTITRHIEQRPADSRLKYIRIPERINSVFNMNHAMAMATGKYVCMIGDDDTILPGIFDMVGWMEREEIDSVTPKIVDYYWPGAYRNESDGTLFIPPFSGDRRQIAVRPRLEQLFRNGIVLYMNYLLPRVYHGVVLRDRMEEIRRRTGHYFGGLSPDIYSTVALSSIVKNHYAIDAPLTIAGACVNSASAESIRGQHKGELHTAPHLILRGVYNWNPLVPAYFSGSMLWAESALKAAGEMGIEGLRFNRSRLAAFALLDDRMILKLALQKMQTCQPSIPMIGTALALGRLLASTTWKRLKVYLLRKKIHTHFDGVENIAQAALRVTKFISDGKPL